MNLVENLGLFAEEKQEPNENNGTDIERTNKSFDIINHKWRHQGMANTWKRDIIKITFE